MRGMRFEGKDERGVPQISGTWDKPPMWFIFIALGVSIWLGYNFAICFQDWIAHGRPGNKADQLYIIVPCVVFGAIGIYLLLLRRLIMTLIDEQELCRSAHLDREAFETFVLRNHIKPRLRINGRDLYDQKDVK